MDFNYFDFGKKRFYFDLIENDFGKSLLIQQKINENGKWVTKGSVFIPLEASTDFIKNLNVILKSKKLQREIKNNGSNK